MQWNPKLLSYEDKITGKVPGRPKKTVGGKTWELHRYFIRDNVYGNFLGGVSKKVFQISGVHLNVSSKLTLKTRLSTHHTSVCTLKSQRTQKVRLDLNNWSLICNPWCVTIDSSMPTLRINLYLHSYCFFYLKMTRAATTL
jgi:hypothetical protein